VRVRIKLAGSAFSPNDVPNATFGQFAPNYACLRATTAKAGAKRLDSRTSGPRNEVEGVFLARRQSMAHHKTDDR